MMNPTTPTHHSRLPVEVSINDNLPTSSPRGKTVFNVLACVLGLIFFCCGVLQDDWILRTCLEFTGRLSWRALS